MSECWAGSIKKDEYLKIIAESGFIDVYILEESQPYAKGKIEICSFTIYGKKAASCGCKG